MFSLCQKIFKPSEIDLLLEDIHFIKTSKKIEYGDVSCAFDIESTSFYEGSEKRAIMYAFVLGINGKCIIGRTWDEVICIMNRISEFYSLSTDKRIIFYVHNLAYEFQFFRKLFKWDRVFSITQRKPVQALTDIGIEFRCSYILSGYSLASVGKNLMKYKVEKMSGDLDYSLLRHSKTPLTDKEIGYILNDGLVVMAYIQERIEDDGNITKIPLTKTGYVRNYCRNMCLYDGSHKKNVQKYIKYHNIMNSLQIRSVNEYKQLKRAFQGGFTHANALYTDRICEDVTSYDFTSSYPSVMICEKFPMSSGKTVKIESVDQFKKYLNLYCCLFDIAFKDLESITSIEHPISYSKCYESLNVTIDNGRVVDADMIKTTITEQDFFIIRKFYKWSEIQICNFRIYKKGYLPTDFIKSILKLYYDKTTLKGVEGSEIEYMKSKENLNSCYGMAVTDICRDEIDYIDNIWSETSVDHENALQKYNRSKRRFLFYPWGIWVTAYARRNLFTGIYELGSDYIYSDTDSIKGIHMDRHMDYINNYNNNVVKKLKRAMDHHHLSMDLVSPKTIEGKIKTMGFWDYDGHYKHFKTLGAKRYMYEKDDESISLTVSGINKKYAIPYLQSKFKNVFDAFTDGLYVPSDYTGKNTHTYIDNEQMGVLVDYTGVASEYRELSSVHMEGAEYSMSMSDAYIDYLLGIREYNE